MITDTMQYAFLQDASELEIIIDAMSKELDSWIRFQVRKYLKLDKTAPLPKNWTGHIGYLNNIIANQFRIRQNRIRRLKLILQNFYTQVLEWEHLLGEMEKDKIFFYQCMISGNEISDNYLSILLKTLEQKNDGCKNE